jgi:hypothetical protein
MYNQSAYRTALGPSVARVPAEELLCSVVTPAGRCTLVTHEPRLLADRFSPLCQKPSKTFMPRSGEVETVKVHDFVPHRYKVVQELLLGVLT